MGIHATFVHANLVARDFDALCAFYTSVFGCRPTMKEGRYTGPWVEAVTQVPGAEIRVMHLALPGFEGKAPTLEIIAYDETLPPSNPAANRPGYGHIAFAVDDVEAARDAVLEAGGKVFGEIASVEIPGRGTVTEVYVADPEGNLIELCRWV
ncbi:MAG: VOC family protein [Planctomycetota bacterium]|jgi:catechol 2,3-dioxygenase-like lactoylglutathione lyase family enzyme